MVPQITSSPIITLIRLSLVVFILLCIVGAAGATPAQAITVMQPSGAVAMGDVMKKAFTGNLPDSSTIHEYATGVSEDRTLVFGAIALSPGLRLNVQVYRVGESQPSACSRTGVIDAVVLCYRDRDDQGPLDNNPNRVYISASAGTGDYLVFARAMGTYASGSNPRLVIDGNADSDSLVARTHKAFLIQRSTEEPNVRLCLSTGDPNLSSLVRARIYDNSGQVVCHDGGACYIPSNSLHYAFTINPSTTQVDNVRISLRSGVCRP